MADTLLARHVLFDLDGTLVDTRRAVFECYRRVFQEELGETFPPASVPTHLLFAMRPAELFAAVAPERAERLLAAYQAGYPAAADLVLTFPGAKDLIPAIRRAGRRASLVTNKGLERSKIDLQKAGIRLADFDVVVTAEDTAERKPHPAPILLALERLGADAAHAVYIGDAPHDVVAARAAGLRSVAITHGFYRREELSDLGADVVVDDIPALASALGLPALEAAV